LFSVSGYGESRLLKGFSPESSKHRRIDLRVSMTPPTLPGETADQVVKDITKEIKKQ